MDLDFFRFRGIPVTWDTVRTGYEGLHGFPPFLTDAAVQEFADARLQAGEGPLAEIAELSLIGHDDHERVMSLMRKLGALESDGDDIEERKWRLALVDRTFRNLPDDPLHGLRELTELWAQLDFPEDSPHVVQGRNNTISPTAYYTEATYADLRNRHAKWIEMESEALTRA